MSAIPEGATCCAPIGTGYRPPSCGRKAKVERSGKFYCFMHDPVRIDERRKIRNAEWDAKWEADKARAERRDRIAAARTAIVDAAVVAARNDDWGLVVAAVDRLVEAEGGQ